MIKAKKHFGQNFLKDTDALVKIFEAIPFNNNKIVEIGPGLGDLTKYLVKRKDVIAYEVDSELISFLNSEFVDEMANGRLNLVFGDVLDLWMKQKTLYDGKYDLVANLPYYIATNIILKALEDSNCEHIIVMVQKEVAHKFISNERESDYGALSVIVKSLSSSAEILFDLPPESFDPPPKVYSSVIFIKKNQNKKFDSGFNKFLKCCFVQPRKTLQKNLQGCFDKKTIENVFDILDIDKKIRPHELSYSLFGLVYERIINNERRIDDKP